MNILDDLSNNHKKYLDDEDEEEIKYSLLNYLNELPREK